MTDERKHLLSVVGGMVPVDKIPAYLISVNDDGKAGFYEVTDLGVHVQSQQVVFCGERVQRYAKLNHLLDDLDMKWGFVKWYGDELDTKAREITALSDSNRGLALKINRLTSKINTRDWQISRLRERIDKLEQTCEDWKERYVDAT